MPNWEGSDRRERLPGNWYSEIRPAILARDGYRCRWVRVDTGTRCTQPASDVDHIRNGDNHAPENLRALCHWHHLKKSGSEGGQASAAARKRIRRNGGKQHPGLLP